MLFVVLFWLTTSKDDSNVSCKIVTQWNGTNRWQTEDWKRLRNTDDRFMAIKEGEKMEEEGLTHLWIIVSYETPREVPNNDCCNR